MQLSPQQYLPPKNLEIIEIDLDRKQIKNSLSLDFKVSLKELPLAFEMTERERMVYIFTKKTREESTLCLKEVSFDPEEEDKLTEYVSNIEEGSIERVVYRKGNLYVERLNRVGRFLTVFEIKEDHPDGILKIAKKENVSLDLKDSALSRHFLKDSSFLAIFWRNRALEFNRGSSKKKKVLNNYLRVYNSDLKLIGEVDKNWPENAKSGGSGLIESNLEKIIGDSFIIGLAFLDLESNSASVLIASHDSQSWCVIRNEGLGLRLRLSGDRHEYEWKPTKFVVVDLR